MQHVAFWQSVLAEMVQLVGHWRDHAQLILVLMLTTFQPSQAAVCTGCQHDWHDLNSCILKMLQFYLTRKYIVNWLLAPRDHYHTLIIHVKNTYMLRHKLHQTVFTYSCRNVMCHQIDDTHRHSKDLYLGSLAFKGDAYKWEEMEWDIEGARNEWETVPEAQLSCLDHYVCTKHYFDLLKEVIKSHSSENIWTSWHITMSCYWNTRVDITSECKSSIITVVRSCKVLLQVNNTNNYRDWTLALSASEQ